MYDVKNILNDNDKIFMGRFVIDNNNGTISKFWLCEDEKLLRKSTEDFRFEMVKRIKDDYENYVQIQSEAALRAMATKYPYDIIEEKDLGGVALSSHQEVVATELRESVQARLSRAGIEVLEARISHLAYAPEVAQAMLRRQQASAVVAARREIVDGAVGMVELALDQLSVKGIIELDEDKKATMVSNLLVVLCSETDTTPVVNTGSLYQ